MIIFKFKNKSFLFELDETKEKEIGKKIYNWPSKMRSILSLKKFFSPPHDFFNLSQRYKEEKKQGEGGGAKKFIL